jgi:hypothetical protein
MTCQRRGPLRQTGADTMSMSIAEQIASHAAIAALQVGDVVVLEYQFRQIVPILQASPKQIVVAHPYSRIQKIRYNRDTQRAIGNKDAPRFCLWTAQIQAQIDVESKLAETSKVLEGLTRGFGPWWWSRKLTTAQAEELTAHLGNVLRLIDEYELEKKR